MRLENSVELLGWYGGDIAIAMSAWTSTKRDMTPEKLARVEQLLTKTLWAADPVPHKTPFEKGIVHFLLNTDIATHIHLLKHRISSTNAECLDGDTLITFVNINGKVSKRLKIKDLYHRFTHGRPHQNTERDLEYSKRRIKSMRLRVLNERTGTFEYSYIKDVWKTEPKSIYKITLRNGKELLCTDNHRIYTDSGYKRISDGLSVGDMVACNGISMNVFGKPWTFREFYEDSENYTRRQFAQIKGIKYELCKKWGYIFSAPFKEDENKNFKKGSVPWNIGYTGYKIDIKNRKHNPKRGENSNFWRGGIASDRDLIGAWTTIMAKKVHKKFNFTCQKCGLNSEKLDAHHIIPVSHDASLAYDFDNLITVCKDCHIDIHKSIKSEMDFAKHILNRDVILSYDRRLGKKVNSCSMVYYSDIVSIEFVKEDVCYDIEVEGEFKNFVANGIVTHNSARYKELVDDKYYLPFDWEGIKIQDDEGILINGQTVHTWLDALEQYTMLGNELYHKSLAELSPILGRKRAKESARFFKPYNSQIACDIMFNMSSFHNFLTQRMDKHAQVEVRLVAQKMVEEVRRIEGNPFEFTLKAWGL